MTERPSPPDPLAAELALGVAERRATDPRLAAEVARWHGRFAALFEAVQSAPPPASLWSRIDSATRPARDNVVTLRRKIGRWRLATAAMTALAASLGLFIMQQPRNVSPLTPRPAQSEPGASPMVAMLGQDQEMKVVASWDPMSRQLVLAVAGKISADPAHSHELWIIPADGRPRSIGTMPEGKQMHMRLADALASLLQQGSTIAITVEPRGGSPTGKPTGPMVASGALTKA